MKGLTPRQLDILTYIERYIEDKGFAPSLREIGEVFSISSVSAVHKHIETLISKEALSKDRYKARSIKRPERLDGDKETEGVFFLTLIGYIKETPPLELSPKPQELPIPKFLVYEPQSTYLLRVKGEGFVEEGIHQGDLLIVEARSHADTGERVLAEINKEKICVKIYTPEEGFIRLSSQNPTVPSLVIKEEDLTIHGVLTGLIRFY